MEGKAYLGFNVNVGLKSNNQGIEQNFGEHVFAGFFVESVENV